MKTSHTTAIVVLCLLLTACGGAPASNETRIDNDGNGRFSGSAGVGVTDAEIRSSVETVVCSTGQSVQVFSRRALSGSTIFSGQCG